MIELFERDVYDNGRQSSKGNQLKWNNNGIWYKADYTGYEGLVEYAISHLLEYSTLDESEYVLYDLEQIKYKSVIMNGAKSKNFLRSDWQIITLERLFGGIYGKSLYLSIFEIEDHKQRLEFLVDQVQAITGLNEFGKYINKVFTIDAFFLNEDRHMHNIAVLMNSNGEYDYCPIFDNGAGLLSDTTMEYPMSGDTRFLMDEVSAKSICASFEEQLELSEILYGDNLTFSFNRKDIERIVDAADIYDKESRERVKDVIVRQMNKYQYLMQRK